jgi:hypothetical protein
VEDLNISYCEFLGVDESSALFVDIFTGTDEINEIVLIYDSDFNLVNEITMGEYDNPYLWNISPFLRQDGIIFEFRVLQEGLEIIRWSKE